MVGASSSDLAWQNIMLGKHFMRSQSSEHQPIKTPDREFPSSTEFVEADFVEAGFLSAEFVKAQQAESDTAAEFVQAQQVESDNVIEFVQAQQVESDNVMVAEVETIEPTHFHGEFVDCMEMNAAPDTVAAYLIDHRDWFRRCALPMQAEPLGERGYAITIGKFGSYGYSVEPKVGLELLPPDAGVYRIKTIPVPGYTPKGYEVDFKASLELAEAVIEHSDPNTESSPGEPPPTVMTRVEWQLDLGVNIWFPKFIHVLPRALIYNTGQHLLRQIVKQFSRRLTRKVQEDFHAKLNRPMPPKTRRRFPWSAG